MTLDVRLQAIVEQLGRHGIHVDVTFARQLLDEEIAREQRMGALLRREMLDVDTVLEMSRWERG